MKPYYLVPGRQRHAILSVVQEVALALGPQVFIRQSKALQQRQDQQSVLWAGLSGAGAGHVWSA